MSCASYEKCDHAAIPPPRHLYRVTKSGSRTSIHRDDRPTARDSGRSGRHGRRWASWPWAAAAASYASCRLRHRRRRGLAPSRGASTSRIGRARSRNRCSPPRPNAPSIQVARRRSTAGRPAPSAASRSPCACACSSSIRVRPRRASAPSRRSDALPPPPPPRRPPPLLPRSSMSPARRPPPSSRSSSSSSPARCRRAGAAAAPPAACDDTSRWRSRARREYLPTASRSLPERTLAAAKRPGSPRFFNRRSTAMAAHAQQTHPEARRIATRSGIPGGTPAARSARASAESLLKRMYPGGGGRGGFGGIMATGRSARWRRRW